MNQKHTTLGHIPIDTMTGDIIACRSHGWSPVSWIIRKRSSSQVNHVASCIGGGTLLEALDKVKQTDVTRLRQEWWVHLRPVNPLTLEQKLNLQKFLLDQDHKKYDWKAILGFGPWNSFDRENGRPDKWFCSELVWASYNHIGIRLVNKPNGYVFPCDILESPLLYVVGYQFPATLLDWVLDDTEI